MSDEKKPIPLFVPTFDVEACLREVRDSLERGWTGMGDKTVKFEQEWSRYTGRKHVHFLNSATSALHLAVKMLSDAKGWKLGPGRPQVITTPLTFVSTNHAILYEECEPVFADVDESGCMDPSSVRQLINSDTRAVMFVGLGGNVGQLDEILSICQKHGLALIVDAAHMAGTRWVGSGPDPVLAADAVCYSFQAVKNLPTGDSGAVSFLDPGLDVLARKMSWLGISKDTYARTLQPGTYKWDYDVPECGYKYNGNAIMAGIALAQLPHLDRDNAYRRMLCDVYERALAAKAPSVAVIKHSPKCISSRHLFQVAVSGRESVMMKMNSVGIYPGVHYKSNAIYAPYQRRLTKWSIPRAERLSDELLSLPLHLRMTVDDAVRVVDTLAWALG